MPELPEVETIKLGLQKTILGKTISKVEVRLSKIISLGPKVVSNIRKASTKTVETFKRMIVGHKIEQVKRRGKMLIVKFSGPFTLLVHLKMTGQLIFAKKGEQKNVKIFNSQNSPRANLPHKYTHLIFSFSDGSRLFYNDLRQFGYLRLVPDNEISKVSELSEYGPEPDAKGFTLDYLISKAHRRPVLTIKQFLMDPKVVAGIGNIYSDETLYWAKLRPNRKLKSLSRREFQNIYTSIPKVLEKALKAGGSSVGDFFKVDGTEGRFGRQHMVYGRYGEPCKSCGEIIEKVKLGGRTSSYCPVCQR